MSGIRDIDWTPSATETAEILRRMQGTGGYSIDAASVRDLMLRAWATTIAAAEAKVVEAFLEGLPSKTDAELEAWERIYRLPNDAARTHDQRRDRLTAAERAYSGGSQAAIDGALDTLTAGANTTIRRAVGTCSADDATELGELAVKIELAASAFADPVTRRAVSRLARRMLPARSIGEIDLPSADLLVSGGTGLAWHSTSKKLDRDTIDATTGITVRTPKSRIRDFGPLSIVRARDLNRIQAESLFSHLNGANTRNVSTAGVGHVVRYVEGTGANGATITFDTSVDWRDRYVHLYLVRSSSDIRPGAASDGSYGTASTPIVGGFDSGAGTTTLLSLDFSASGAGALQATNSTGSTVYVAGIVVGMPTFYEGRVDDELASPFYDGASAGRLSKSWLDRMLAARMKPATGLTDAVDADPIHRFAVLPNVRTKNVRSHYIIDASIDWRDRFVALGGAMTVGPGSYVASIYPGANDSGNTVPIPIAFYSRDGEAPGSVTATSNVAEIGGALGATILVYADSTTGALTVTHVPDGDEGSGPWPAVLFHFWIRATGRTGHRGTTPTAWSGSVTDGNAIRSHELNELQDLIVPSQALGSSAVSIDAFPLGRIGDGWPRIPSTFVDRDGAESRQNVSGAIRRVFAATLASASTTVLDTAHDWRDRIVSTFGAANTLPIYRDGASRSSVGYMIPWGAYFRKVGSEWSHGAQLGAAADGFQVLFARETDGALVAVNTAASGVHIVGSIEASPKLGPLTPASVKDRDFSRAYPTGTMLGDPDLVVWLDAGLGPIRNYAGGVEQWIDRSLAGLDPSPASSTRPTWAASTFDSSPGVTFSGASSRFTADPTSVLGSSGITIVAFLLDSTTSESAPFDIATARVNGAGRVFVTANPSGATGSIEVAFATGGGSAGEVWRATASLASPTCFAFAINGFDGASPIEGIRINGSPSGSRYSISGSYTANFSSSTKLTIGADADGTRGWAGTIGQLAIFRRVLTGAEIAKVESEMKGSKYPSITLGGSTSWT